MKKLLSLCLLMAASFSSQAENFLDNTILGVALINQNVDIEVKNSSGSTSDSESGTGLGIYLDKYYQRKYRFNGTASYITYDDFDILQTMVSADYLFPINNTLTLFGGGAVGGAMQKYSDASIGDSSLGFVYGVQVGGIAYINKNIMIELGYRFRPTDIETDVKDSPGTTTVVDDLSETYLSVLLMF